MLSALAGSDLEQKVAGRDAHRREGGAQRPAPGPTSISTSRCERIIAKLVIPQPFDLDTFLAELSAQRGRPIVRVSAALPTTGHLCGMLVSTDDADYICSAAGLPPLLEQHTAIHEVGHLLFDHGSLAASSADDHSNVAATEAEALGILMPNLSPALIRRILGRGAYASVQEREAELFASLLLTRVTSQHYPVFGPTGHEPLDVLGSAFALQPRAPR
jgi:hypothetical protein